MLRIVERIFETANLLYTTLHEVNLVLRFYYHSLSNFINSCTDMNYFLTGPNEMKSTYLIMLTCINAVLFCCLMNKVTHPARDLFIEYLSFLYDYETNHV